MITRLWYSEPKYRAESRQSSCCRLGDDDGKIFSRLSCLGLKICRKYCPSAAMCAADMNMNALNTSELSRWAIQAVQCCTNRRVGIRSKEWTWVPSEPRSRCSSEWGLMATSQIYTVGTPSFCNMITRLNGCLWLQHAYFITPQLTLCTSRPTLVLAPEFQTETRW